MGIATNLAPYQMIGQGIQTAGNLVSTLLTNKANKEENERTRAYNLELWNKENAYNTPAAQMQRYKDAGLNTNLIYGSGASGGNAGSPSPASPVRYNAPQLDMPNLIGILSAYQQFQNNKAQMADTVWSGITKREMAKRAILQNWIDFGPTYQNLMPAIDYGKPSESNWLGRTKTVYTDKSELPSTDMLANMRAEMNYKLLYNLNRIRYSEAGMSESLKDWNMTAADSIWARMLKKAMDGLGVFNK